MPAAALLAAADTLCGELAHLHFAEPVHLVYNPLIYARDLHAAYVRRFAHTDIDALFVGMNPGPFGMAQTGVPFGEITAVRDWMGLKGTVGKPPVEHPRRPVLGLACSKSEVSGRRLWGLCQERFTTPEAFFAKHFVANWCPLAFMDADGANLTPDKLPTSERLPLEVACDAHLVAVVRALRPRVVVGVGGFAEKRAIVALKAAGLQKIQVGTVLHPSPASPAANRDWAGQATKQLRELGVWDS